MEQQIEQYYLYHFIATLSLLMLTLVFYAYPLIGCLLILGVLGYFYVKSQRPVMEEFYYRLV